MTDLSHWFDDLDLGASIALERCVKVPRTRVIMADLAIRLSRNACQVLDQSVRVFRPNHNWRSEFVATLVRFHPGPLFCTIDALGELSADGAGSECIFASG